MSRSVTLPLADAAADGLGFFRWGSVAGKALLTTDGGDWAWLDPAELADLLAGRVVAGHPRFAECQQKGLVREGLDVDALVARVAQRNRHLQRGPHLHVVTLSGPDGAMSETTAERVAELALQSTSPALVFELQADDGEPLRHFELLRRFVAQAQRRNQRTAGKALSLRLLSNLTAMTAEIAEWLVASGVQLITTLDGPAALHDANRAQLGGSAHAEVVGWVADLQRRAAAAGRDARGVVDALARMTRHSRGAAAAIVAEYVARGLPTVDPRPLSRARLDDATWAALGLADDEYLALVRELREEVLARRRAGVAIADRLTTVVAQKILGHEDPGVVDLQSPCGAGTGQLVYGADGQVFPCDEARGLDADGAPLFGLGAVGAVTLADVVRHPTTRALAAASLLDTLPQCAECWNKPYCGVNPVRTFRAQGDLIGQRPHCVECREHLAVSTRLFELLDPAAGPEAAAVVTSLAAEPAPFDGRLAKDAP
ncbi:MAG: hypothetical protein SF182_14390 [Deltaproteobacteria bacterium]|nr:hypothetical protein [Deltaproteobacteria bacterium]